MPMSNVGTKGGIKDPRKKVISLKILKTGSKGGNDVSKK
jgi:hypothetical protein